MNGIRRLTAIGILTAALVAAGSVPAAAAAPGGPGTSHTRMQADGVFYTAGDWVHVTNGRASGHGWWVNESSTATQAVVTVQLQLNRGGAWINVGPPGQKTVFAGGGSANRAATRTPCVNTATTQWRSEVDVDLVGSPDSPEKGYTEARSLACGA